MNEEQIRQLVNKPIDEHECIIHGASIGLNEEQSLIFYFHYESVEWVLEREDGTRVPIRNWRARMSLWKFKDQVLQRVAAKAQAQKLEHWKQQDARRRAENNRENQLRKKEGQKLTYGTESAWNDYTWYCEQIHLHGPKINDRIEMSTINGKNCWRYK